MEIERYNYMKTIYFFGHDHSIYESLESLSKIKKSFLIKKIDKMEKKKLKSSLLIIDDSFKDFLKLIKSYPPKEKNNLIVATKKENINLNTLQDLKFFVKPIKILDLYKEILKKIKDNSNDSNFSINHSDFSFSDKKGRKLKLTEKEFKLFIVLLNSNGKALNRKNLLYDVWGLHLEKLDSLNTRVLETLISRIRKKIILSKVNMKIIKSKSGYLLINEAN